MLRTKVMLALGGLLIVLLSMGLYSINQCSTLGHRIEAIARDRDATGRDLNHLKQSGEAMTGSLLFSATGQNDRALTEFSAAASTFDQALGSLTARSCDCPGEKKMLADVSSAFIQFRGQAQTFLDAPTATGKRDANTAAMLGNGVKQLLGRVDKLAQEHDLTLARSGEDPGKAILKTTRLLWLLMILAIVVAGLAVLGLNRGLLTPLSSLAHSIRLVGEGNLDQTVPVLSRDELGQLATSFNQMAAQLKVYRATTSVELSRLNLTIRATLASFPDPIFVLNAEGAVEFRNPEADELALKLLFSGVVRLPREVDERVEHVRATGQDYLPTLFKDAIKFHLDGKDRYFLPRIVLLRNEKRETFGVAVILEDVTRMLLLDDVKSNLISTVSHELKTPLTSVRMALYLLVEKTVGPLNEKQLDLVETAREDADRLLHTLNDLLDLAKLEQGPTLLNLVPTPPEELVGSAVRTAREIAHAAGIQLVPEVGPGLPRVPLDSQRIAYVFANLVTNAIKYSPTGSLVAVQAVPGKTRTGAPAIRFSVQDQGPGIEPEHQAHVFERFYRVPGTNKSGAGLGLSIAREIVAAHQGEIGVISAPGKGSEFFFVLPLPPASTNGQADGAK